MLVHSLLSDSYAGRVTVQGDDLASACYIPMLWDWPSCSPLSVCHMLPFFSAHRLKMSLCSEQLDYMLKFGHLFPNDMTSAGVLRMVAESTAQHSVLAVGYYKHAFHQNTWTGAFSSFSSGEKCLNQPCDCFVARRLLTCRWDGSCRLVCERWISKVDDQNLLVTGAAVRRCLVYFG